MLDRLRKLIRPAEIKASRTARLIAIENPGRARWTPRDYAALAREGYIANAVVYRAVNLVAQNAASCCFLLYEGAAERERHPMLDLLARPNPRQDGPALFEAVYSYLLLAGNAYVEAVTLGDSNGSGTRDVRELYCLRPDRMRVIPGEDGWADAYEYSVAGRSVRFDQNATPVPPILHLTAFHPLDDHYGLSALEAAAVAVDVHNSAARWNKALLDNSARPSGALVYDGPEGAVLADSQYERLKRELELSLVECPGFALTMLHALWTGHQAGIDGFASLSALLMAYFAARFGVLGVYVSGRTREKQCLVTGQSCRASSPGWVAQRRADSDSRYEGQIATLSVQRLKLRSNARTGSAVVTPLFDRL